MREKVKESKEKKDQCGSPSTSGEHRVGRLNMAYHSLEEGGEQGGSVRLTVHCMRAESIEIQFGLPSTRGEQGSSKLSVAYHPLEESKSQGTLVWLTIH